MMLLYILYLITLSGISVFNSFMWLCWNFIDLYLLWVYYPYLLIFRSIAAVLLYHDLITQIHVFPFYLGGCFMFWRSSQLLFTTWTASVWWIFLPGKYGLHIGNTSHMLVSLLYASCFHETSYGHSPLHVVVLCVGIQRCLPVSEQHLSVLT